MNDYSYIIDVVKNGIKISNKDLTDQRLNVWVEYATKSIDITIKDYPTVSLNFLKIINEFQSRDIAPSSKLNLYLKYLIEILKILKKQ